MSAVSPTTAPKVSPMTAPIIGSKTRFNHATAELAGDLTAIDLFCGAGGSTAGLRSAGYQVLVGVEFDEDAAATYRANHRDVRLYENDINTIDPETVLAELGIAPGELTLLNACPPCQGFSTLGTRRDDDERNDLILSVWPWIKAFRPKAFIVENVPGIQTDHRLARVLRLARRNGYGVKEYRVEAVDFGVPQNRVRHIVVGVAGLSKSEMPDHLTELLPDRLIARRPKPVKHVFQRSARLDQDKDPLHRWRELKPKTLRRIQAVPVGGGRHDLPKELQLDCHKRLGSRHASSVYGRMRLEEPAPTMTTRCTSPSCGAFVHPTEHRGISLREAALIQTFPPNYKFCGAYGSIERQIGNAVPVRMAEALGLAVLSLSSLGDRETDS